MRSSVGPRLVRVRRDLRFVLADRYRRLLGSRFALLASVAATLVDLAVRLSRRGRRPATATTTVGLAVVRAVVLGGQELSLTVAGAPEGVDAVVFRDPAGTETVADTVLDAGGELLRLVALLPDTVTDGSPQTVLLRTEGGTVTLPAATTNAPTGVPWPPAVGAGVDGSLTLTGRRPEPPPVTDHAVRLGIRGLEISWPERPDSRLVLVGDGDETTHEAQPDGGRSVVRLDLAELVSTGGAATLAAFVEVGGARAPLALPPAPRPSAPRPPRYVRLPTTGPTACAVTVDYASDGQLVVRVGDRSAA